MRLVNRLQTCRSTYLFVDLCLGLLLFTLNGLVGELFGLIVGLTAGLTLAGLVGDCGERVLLDRAFQVLFDLLNLLRDHFLEYVFVGLR